jgi:hypothetical protein
VQSHKVLADVVRTMYSTKFVAELFKPQEVYTNRATRQIFDRLAHSSIMRLNKNSMDKLYDLMTMGFKYQMLRSICPAQLLHVTLNHLEALKRIVAEPSVEELVDAAIRQSVELYSRLPLGELASLHLTLARFFQDRRVKVSLFLQDGIQNMDGTIVLTVNGPLPPLTEPPGVIRYFDSKGKVSGTDRLPALVVQGAVPAGPADTALCLSAGDGRRTCVLGENLYAKVSRLARERCAAHIRFFPCLHHPLLLVRMQERSAKPSGPPGVSASPSASAGGGVVAAAPEPALSSSVVAEPYEATVTSAADCKEALDDLPDTGRHARAALDLLSSLLGTPSGGSDAPFKLALFSGDDGAYQGGGGDSSGGGVVISFDASDSARLAEMMKRLGLDDDKPAARGGGGAARGGGKEPEEDDLLAMMDAAVGSSDSKA